MVAVYLVSLRAQVGSLSSLIGVYSRMSRFGDKFFIPVSQTRNMCATGISINYRGNSHRGKYIRKYSIVEIPITECNESCNIRVVTMVYFVYSIFRRLLL